VLLAFGHDAEITIPSGLGAAAVLVDEYFDEVRLAAEDR